MFTCVPEAEREKFYPQHRFSHVTFVGVLAGYVPLDYERHQDLALPLSQRPVEIGYRGRRLAYWYGSLAMEKWWIGREVDALCRDEESCLTSGGPRPTGYMTTIGIAFSAAVSRLRM